MKNVKELTEADYKRYELLHEQTMVIFWAAGIIISIVQQDMAWFSCWLVLMFLWSAIQAELWANAKFKRFGGYRAQTKEAKGK